MAESRTGNFLMRWLVIAIVLILAACSSGSDDEDSTATSPVESTTVRTQEPVVTLPPTIGSPASSPTTSGSPVGPDLVVSFGQTEPMCPVDPEGYLDAEQYREGLLCVVQIFPWPKAKVPDAMMVDDMVARDSMQEKPSFQDGFQYGTMASYNACAWIETWYDAYLGGDQATQDTALIYLQEFVPRPWEKNSNIPADIYDESVSRPYQQMAEGASLGDPSAIVEFMNGSRCGDFEWPAA